ncbi:hypothetical protein BKA83DRAFT_674959 [Pisolithus microcarpus]|nr:hypothetical protein BKA83DRAFT_674959 [Pisolithus microcarpus]
MGPHLRGRTGRVPFSMSAWVAPNAGKYGQVHVIPVPQNGPTEPPYPEEFLFRFTRV